MIAEAHELRENQTFRAAAANSAVKQAQTNDSVHLPFFYFCKLFQLF